MKRITDEEICELAGCSKDEQNKDCHVKNKTDCEIYSLVCLTIDTQLADCEKQVAEWAGKEDLYGIIEDAISWGVLHPDFKLYHDEIEVKIKDVIDIISQHFAGKLAEYIKEDNEVNEASLRDIDRLNEQINKQTAEIERLKAELEKFNSSNYVQKIGEIKEIVPTSATEVMRYAADGVGVSWERTNEVFRRFKDAGYVRVKEASNG